MKWESWEGEGALGNRIKSGAAYLAGRSLTCSDWYGLHLSGGSLLRLGKGPKSGGVVI